jgi:acyl-CoA dehydrogenase
LDFALSEEEALFRESVARVMERLVGGGRWAEVDEAGVIPWDFVREMGRQGLFAIPVPEEKGGPGGTWLMAAIALEEVGRADPSMNLAVFTLLNNAWPFVLARHGDPEVYGEVLEALSRGEAFYGIASTEPSGGSDVAGIQTRAEREGDGYRVRGEKILISGVREALEQAELGGWTLLARTGGEGHRGLTAFAFIPRRRGRLEAEGLSYEILETVGRRAISTGILRLEGVRIPARSVLGGEGRGFYVAMEGFTLARILVAAANVGAASWALERAVEWARERRLFGGRPIASFQGVSFPLAEAWVELEAARMLVYRAAWTADRYLRGEAQREQLNMLSAASKMKAVEAAFKAFETAMKTLGGISFVKETNLFRGLLGSLSYLVGAEGTQNIMRYIVARDLIGREYVKQ